MPFNQNFNKPPSGTLLNKNHPLSQGIVVYYLMNEGSGQYIYDYSGNNKHLLIDPSTTFGPMWVNGHHGVVFNVNRDAITDEHASSAGSLSALVPYHTSYCAWIRSDAAVIEGTIISEWVQADHRYGTHFGTSWGAPLERVNWQINADITPRNIFSTTTFDDGNWMFAVGTYDGANVALWINGEDETGAQTSSQTGNIDYLAGQGIDVGKHNPTASGAHHFSGEIGSIWVYNRVLTEREIQALYMNPYQVFKEVPYVFYSFIAGGGGESLTEILSETLNLLEASKKAGILKRILGVNLNISAQISRISTLKRTILSTIEIAEGQIRLKGFFKALSSVLNLTESSSIKTFLKHVIDESLSISESILKKRSLIKILTRQMRVYYNIWFVPPPGVRRVIIFRRFFNQSISLSESLSFKKTFFKIVSEIVNLSESLVKETGALFLIEIQSARKIFTFDNLRKTFIKVTKRKTFIKVTKRKTF